MPTLYDAARCPYCARVRIVLAEKGIAYQPVETDGDLHPPGWLAARIAPHGVTLLVPPGRATV